MGGVAGDEQRVSGEAQAPSEEAVALRDALQDVMSDFGNQLVTDSKEVQAMASVIKPGTKEMRVPGFYSNAWNAVEGVKQDKATPEQWLSMLTKAGGIKAGEDKWIGLSEWLKGQDSYIRTGDYIPQPGDYVFFTWTSGVDTDHVALVEFCSRDESGKTLIHVIEGNNPVSVARNVYSLYDTQILGYGTVHDLADITMRFGNSGEKVRQLQESLAYLGYLEPRFVTGDFGNATASAVRDFQSRHGLKTNSIANQATQRRMQDEVDQKKDQDPATWTVIDEDD